MFKHALLTAFLVVVASVLGVAGAQMNESSQAFMAAHDKMMKSMALASSDNQKQETVQFEKWQAEHM